MYALVDCNSFYASCEQIFRPDLRGRPLVVLSNNDGFIIARSAEARALGIPGVTPYFKVASLLERRQVAVFSSNYELYGDISRRVMTTLQALMPALEVYSIDEAFANLEGITGDLGNLGRTIRDAVWQQQRVPVSLGIAPTRTLAKLAGGLAKRIPALKGVCLLDNPTLIRRALAATPVVDIWGVGHRLAARLQTLGIETAEQLSRQDPKYLRRQFNVTLEKTVRELRGESCLEADQPTDGKQQIFCTRMFGKRVETLQPLQEAVAFYATRAAEKLRIQNSLTPAMLVFIQTGRHDPNPAYRSAVVQLPCPTDDSRVLAGAARKAVAGLYLAGYRYSKGGVGLLELVDNRHYQPGLFEGGVQSERSRRLMATLDTVNRRWHGALFPASTGIERPWAMARRLKSPAYTTRWKELPVIAAN